MTLEEMAKEAAKTVEELCKRAGHHTVSNATVEPALCSHCREVVNRILEIGRRERDPIITTTVHFVIDPVSGRMGAKMDELEAIAAARKIKGVTVSWPVSGDYRNTPDPPETTDG